MPLVSRRKSFPDWSSHPAVASVPSIHTERIPRREDVLVALVHAIAGEMLDGAGRPRLANAVEVLRRALDDYLRRVAERVWQRPCCAGSGG